MNDKMPPSLTRFAAELERALRRELGLDGTPRRRRRLRAHPRVLAGTSLGMASAGIAIALALTAASSPPAFAVTRNHDGTYSVTLKDLRAIPAANKQLARMSLHAQLVQVRAGCVATWSLTQGARKDVLRGEVPATLKAMRLAERDAATAKIDPRGIPRGRLIVIPAWRVGRQVKMAQALAAARQAPVCVPPIPPSCLPPAPVRLQQTGKSASSGNSGSAGNSGNSGSSGSSGNSGNSGSAGNSGTSGSASRHQVQVMVPAGPQPAGAQRCTLTNFQSPPPSGHSGTSGNSGSS